MKTKQTLLKQGKRAMLLIAARLLSTTGGFGQVLFDAETGAVFSGRYNTIQIPQQSESTRFDAFSSAFKTKPVLNLRFRFGYTFNDRHTVSLYYAPLRLESTTNGGTSQPYRFQNQVFGPGQPLRVRYQFNGYRLTYRYDFIRRENLRAGVGLTLNVRDAYVKLNNESQNAAFTNVGLVPLLNVYVRGRLANRLGALLEGDVFAVKDGRVEDLFAGLTYRLSSQIALKGGYRLTEGGASGDDIYNYVWVNTFAAGVVFGLR